MSLDEDEEVEFTEVEQSEDEQEPAVADLGQESVEAWRLISSPKVGGDEVLNEEFMAELYLAADQESLDNDGVGAFQPFRSVSEIPVIKYEREASYVRDRQTSDATLQENQPETQLESDSEDQISTYSHLRGEEDNAVADIREEHYEYSWTGM